MLSGWSRISIAGKQVDLFEPPNPAPFALLYLHSERGETPADDSRLSAELRASRLRCVAPHGARSWWLNRICSEFDPHVSVEQFLLEQVVPWIQTQWTLPNRSIGVAGREMGGQGAVRIAFRYSDRFPVVASIDGAFDFHEHFGEGSPLDELYPSREYCRQDTAILHVPPRDCPELWFSCALRSRWYRGNDRLHEKLAAMGIPHTAELNDVTEDPRTIAAMLAFIVAGLERQSLRLM